MWPGLTSHWQLVTIVHPGPLVQLGRSSDHANWRRKGEKEFDYSYKSVYRTRVTLNNGGRNWSVGDTVTVTMEGKDYTVKVERSNLGTPMRQKQQPPTQHLLTLRVGR